MERKRTLYQCLDSRSYDEDDLDDGDPTCDDFLMEDDCFRV